MTHQRRRSHRQSPATSDWAEGALRRWMFRLKSIDAAGPIKRASLDRLFGEKTNRTPDSQDSHGISRPRAPSDECGSA